MLKKLATKIRNRWHPYGALRRIPLFQKLQRWADFVVYTPIPDTRIRVAVKVMRDASWVADPENLAVEVRRGFDMAMEVMKPRTFWDVGANIGYYSWLARQQPSVEKIYMFEPDPTNFDLLQRTIKKNAIQDCSPLRVALSDNEGTSQFLIDDVSGATGSLIDVSTVDDGLSLQSRWKLNRKITCQTTTIDRQIANGCPPPELLKIDVEGAEGLVIDGGVEFFSSHRPAILIETGEAHIISQFRQRKYLTYQMDEINFLLLPAEAVLDTKPFDLAFPVK